MANGDASAAGRERCGQETECRMEKRQGLKKTPPRPGKPYPACHEETEPIEKPMTVLYGPPEVLGLDPEQKARGPVMESVYAAPPRLETKGEKRRLSIFGKDKTKK